MNDLELWNALKGGSRQALEQIYRTQITRLIKYGRKFTRDDSLVEDCLHDLFVEIWKNRKRIGETDSIIRYLFVALRRKIIRALKHQNKTLLQDSVSETFFSAQMSVDARMIERELSREQMQRLQDVMNQLTNRQREVIYLKYFAGLDYQEIAEVMEISYQSARNLNHKALQTLRSQMTIWALWLQLSIFFMQKSGL